MRMTKNKRMIQVNLDIDLVDELEKRSKALGISRSALINMVMRGAVMGETTGMLLQLLGTAIESQKSGENQDAENGVLVTA